MAHMNMENNPEMESNPNMENNSKMEEKPKILVVDDDEIHLELSRVLLEDNYDVTTVKSCEEALKLLYQGLAPSLIFLDLLMPEVSGWDTYNRIRGISNLHQVPIAIFTASSDLSDKERAKEMGASDFIKKPCTQDELLGRITKIMGESSGEAF